MGLMTCGMEVDIPPSYPPVLPRRVSIEWIGHPIS